MSVAPRDRIEASDRFVVGEAPVCAADLRPLVASARAGAICTFEGTVRDHTGDVETTHLEYEAYASMAVRVFASIADEAAGRWPGISMAIHHRVGRLEVGDVSVAIAVGSEHRVAAFEACRFAIDQLKDRAPIWKKEFGPDGSFWVEGPNRETATENAVDDNDSLPAVADSPE